VVAAFSRAAGCGHRALSGGAGDRLGSGGSHAVPEPGTIAMLLGLLAGITILLHRGRA